MTAKEYFKDWNLNNYYDSNNHSDLINIMNGYTKMKCKKLLEAVSEKAYAYIEYDCPVIDKDSILNAVDLDEFIK